MGGLARGCGVGGGRAGAGAGARVVVLREGTAGAEAADGARAAPPGGRGRGGLVSRAPPGLRAGLWDDTVDGAVVEADARAVGEALPTEAADEGPLAGVDALVDLQRPRLREALAALRAAVGLLPRVRALVCPHASQVREASPTVGARVGPLARVDAPVDLERARLAEALAAVRAGVGPGAGVHVQVDAQVAVGVEGSAALGAQEAAGLGGVLRALMLQQLRRAREGGAAVHARVLLRLQAFLLRVALLVPQQLGAGREGALAGEAGKWRWGLRGRRGSQLRAGQAGREGAVVVVEVVVVGMGVGVG